MPTVYRIRNWEQHFEVAQSKKAAKLRWVAFPNKHDGKSFRRLMRSDPSLALYGGWCATVQVASKCPVRGLLADGDGPLSVVDIADSIGCSTSAIQNAIDACLDATIGWIESTEWNDELARSVLLATRSAIHRGGTTLQDITEHNTPLPPDDGGGDLTIRGLSKAQLADTNTVLRWLDTHRVRLRLSTSYETTCRVLAAADMALADGVRRPSGLFRHVVDSISRGDFSQIADDRFLRAKERLRELENRTSQGSLPPLVVNALGGIGGVGDGA